MKLATHAVFTAGILALILRAVGVEPWRALWEAWAVSILANVVIDFLGHRGRRRSPLTHTPLRSLAWGALSSAPAVYLAHSYLPLLAGALAGPLHLALDVVTEHGIYICNPKCRRFALAHVRYNDPLANALAVLLGIGSMYLALAR